MTKSMNVTVTENLELPGISSIPKKRGRPPTGTAKSNAVRQAAFRRNRRAAVSLAIGETLKNPWTASTSVLLDTLREVTVWQDAGEGDYRKTILDLVQVLTSRYSNV